MKRQPKWTLLYKDNTWLYEPLRKYEVNARIRKGWKVIK